LAGAGGLPSSGGAPVADCTGSFGTTTTQVLPDEPSHGLASPTLSADELELFYARTSEAPAASNNWTFRRSLRASKSDSFPLGTDVPELDPACNATDAITIDLSLDGLTAYLACAASADINNNKGPLRVAHRADRNAPFVLDPMSYGEIGLSASVSADGLHAYTSTENYAEANEYANQYSRASLDAPFGPATPIAAITGFTAPDISDDDLSLYGASSGGIWVVQRASAAGEFMNPVEILPSSTDASMMRYGAPSLSADCRSLYVVGITTSANGEQYTVQVTHRM
jgi:hypothetical protein